MKRMAVPLLALALAACSGGYEEQRQGQGVNSAVARFVAGGEVTVIQVTVSDRLALRSADLIDADGVVVTAYSIEANRAVAYGQAGFGPVPPSGIIGGAGIAGGSNGGLASGVDVTFPIGSWYRPGSQTVYTGQIQSTALIRLPHPEDYRRDWQSSRIDLRLGDPPDVTFLTLPAPSPPAGL
jgi:hypothetical protein